MVNADRVKSKLPSLLINGNTTDPEFWKIRNRMAYRIQMLRLQDPEKYGSLNAKLIKVLEEYETALLRIIKRS
jgi:hypothetical protein